MLPALISNSIATTGFQRGTLPICYLSLPLITGRLHDRDCIPLRDKFSSRFESRTARFLYFAGRLQLLKIILAGIVGYWRMYIILPKGVLKS